VGRGFAQLTHPLDFAPSEPADQSIVIDYENPVGLMALHGTSGIVRGRRRGDHRSAFESPRPDRKQTEELQPAFTPDEVLDEGSGGSVEDLLGRADLLEHPTDVRMQISSPSFSASSMSCVTNTMVF
jgi:hypothetical protein